MNVSKSKRAILMIMNKNIFFRFISGVRTEPYDEKIPDGTLPFMHGSLTKGTLLSEKVSNKIKLFLERFMDRPHIIAPIHFAERKLFGQEN